MGIHIGRVHFFGHTAHATTDSDLGSDVAKSLLALFAAIADGKITGEEADALKGSLTADIGDIHISFTPDAS